MEKLLLYDLETTGTDYWRHAIHQLSAMAVINGQIVDSIDLRIRPHEKAHIDEAALKVGGVTLETVMLYPHRSDQFKAFIAFLNKHIDPYNPEDKFFLVGYNNAGFDDKFLRNFFILEDDNSFGCWFFNNSIDVMVLASHYLMPERHKMPSFKLHRVAKWVGVAVDDSKLHDGVYDLEITYKVYQIVKGKTINDDW